MIVKLKGLYNKLSDKEVDFGDGQAITVKRMESTLATKWQMTFTSESEYDFNLSDKQKFIKRHVIDWSLVDEKDKKVDFDIDEAIKLLTAPEYDHIINLLMMESFQLAMGLEDKTKEDKETAKK